MSKISIARKVIRGFRKFKKKGGLFKRTLTVATKNLRRKGRGRKASEVVKKAAVNRLRNNFVGAGVVTAGGLTLARRAKRKHRRQGFVAGGALAANNRRFRASINKRLTPEARSRLSSLRARNRG